MAKPDSNTIVDVTQDPALQGLGNTKTTIKIGPLPDSTYVDKNVQIINNPGGNTDEVQFNSGGSFAGDNGLKYNKSTDQLTVKGNLNVGGWVKGKIFTNTYNFFLTGGTSGQVLSTDGNGNLSWVDQSGGGGGTNYSNSNVSAYLATFTGNVAAGNIKTNNLLYSNGVAWNLNGTYSNSNVANYLPTYTGNVTAGNVKTDNLLYANGVAWNLNGTYSNSNVSNYLPSYDGDLSPTNIHVTTNSLLGDNATANSYYVYRDSNQVSLGQLGANTIDINSSGITITSNNEEWKFSQDGLLHLAPTGIRFADSSIQSTAYLGISNIIQDGNSSVEVAIDANVSITAYTKGWTFDTDGNITLPVGGDILDSNGVSVLGNSVVFTGDNQPNTSVEGTLWWDSNNGRGYIKYDNQWVDFTPQTVPPDPANPFDQDLNTTDNVTFNNINAANLQINDLDTTIGAIANLESTVIRTLDLRVDNNLIANNVSAGNVTANYFIGDGSQLTNLPIPEANNAIIVSDTAPNANVEGKQWFNSVDGKTYVAYNNQWVDSNPQTIDARALRTNLDDDVEIPKHTIYTNGRMYQDVSEGMSSIRWVNVKGTSDMELLRAYRSGFENDDETGEVGQIGVKIQDSNLGGVYLRGFNGESAVTWSFDGTGNITFPDDTVQTTAFQPATLLDGGGANSTYNGNYQPGSIPNPFDQELNTNDIVQFANVTAGYFIGDGSQLTNIPTSNADTGNVTFSNQTIIGTGDIYGGGGLYLAQGPASVANLQYFRIRGGDNPTHLHFDTANNDAYDQYFGDDNKYLKLELGTSGAVVIGTNTNTWTFGIDGNLTLPTNTSAINYANGSPLTAAVANVTTDNFRINGEERGLIVDAGDLKRFGFMKYAGIEGSLVHSAATGNAVPLRIGRTSTQDVTAANVNTFTTEIYVGTNGYVRIADDNVNNINDPTERLEVTGNIKTTGNLIASNNVLSNGYGKFSGSFDESIGAYTGVVLGYAGGTPRILFGTGNTLQTFEIDNDGGNLRFYQPGSTKATLTSSGNLSVTGSITATNIGNISALNLDGNSSNILFGNGVFASAPSTYSNTNVSALLSSFGSNNISTTGNVTAANFSGNISITGNVTGTSPNVSLVAGSYTSTFDNTGVATLPGELKAVILTSTNSNGNEGGELNLTKSPNSSLSGSTVIVDQYIDRIRFFEAGGTTRGAYIDLSQSSAGVGTLLNNRVSGLVNAGTFVTMDLIKATLTSTGNRGLSLASTTGSFSVLISGTYSTTGATVGGSAGGGTINTTPSTSQFNWNFLGAGDTSTYIITDTTNSRAYRIILQVGSSFTNNLITIERLV